MQKKRSRFHIGLRTIKTAVAVVIAMLIVESYGTTTSRLIFAMLGAMGAVQTNFKESLLACVTQIVGVLLGAAVGIIFASLPIPALVAAGIGMIVMITVYNVFSIRFSPSLSCFIVVMICTTPDVQPFVYAYGRIWDTAIGLSVGMIINTLIFPYDNSHRIRWMAESLDKELTAFLENMFDGNNRLPDTDNMTHTIDDLAQQLQLFANQKLLLHLRRQKELLEIFRQCERNARQLVAHMEVLCRMEHPGRLNEENRRKLTASGADIRDKRVLVESTDHDIVTNYHVSKILLLRRELLDSIGQIKRVSKKK